MTRRVLAVDLDGVITQTDHYKSTSSFDKTSMHQRQFHYSVAKPNHDMVDFLHNIDREKYEVVIYTSRDRYFKDVTKHWLDVNDVPYDEIVFNKLYFDYFIDDKATNKLSELEWMMKNDK